MYHNEKEKDKPMVYLTVTLLYGKVGYLEKNTQCRPFANKEGSNRNEGQTRTHMQEARQPVRRNPL